MLNDRRLRAFFLSVLVGAFVFVPQKTTFAQEPCSVSGVLDLELTLSPVLENAQVLGLASLGIDAKGAGPVLVSGQMRNNTAERLTNLYFEFKIQAGQIGTIAELTQQAAYPFSLNANQFVYATNNNVQDEQIPGITDNMKFDGGLTPDGEEFIESLGGATTLPADVYTVQVTISQVTNACGKMELANQIIELGVSETGAVVDEKSIFLRTPGDLIGADVTITNQYPQMSWEGDAANKYRVIMVSAEGQESPETLIQSAKSTAPTTSGGNLLEFENLDYVVEGNNLQYPASGAQALQLGQTYYWQVSTEIQTASGTEEVLSEIWTFTLTDPGSDVAATTREMDEETYLALISIVGEEQYAALVADGFFFEGIQLDGEIFSGTTGALKLAEILEKIEDGTIIINQD